MTQLVLLSGGSGKRLWPLSNEARSKQFLHLLEAPDGSRESMLQRVIRQARSSGPECEMTIATNQVQKDIIINQLGDGVGIVTEPQRRNTFPAIALACAYLRSVKGCGHDETVIVMPCDPYTGDGYFRTMAKMAESLGQGQAELVLMGIRPDCPSEKFGYIIPGESLGSARKVLSFTEKPDTARAEELLRRGACWNGGVFAFRLGYVLDMLSSYLDDTSFQSVYDNYSLLPKTSFDYEVVEKASSVAFVEYEGEWKDLGTWNSLSEVLPSHVSGNALLGPHSRDTHIVNELSVPIFCDGLESAVVAASPDGILIASKDCTEGIRSYVEGLSDRPMYEERRWGVYTVMGRSTYSDGYKSITKKLTIYAGRNISYQVHAHRDEIWTFVDGEGLLVLDGVTTKVGRGDVVHIKKGQYHAIKALTDLQIIEVQTGDLLDENDIVRVGWDW